MRPRIILSERDQALLLFLWRWKFATSLMLARRFYSESSEWAAYKRLLKLHKGGFIQSVYPRHEAHHFWCLTQLGFRLLQGKLSPLSQAGFLSEALEHDLLVTAAHLGDWIKAEPPNALLFTEQELRRISPEHYPAGIPKSQIHRSDGYWLFNNGKAQRLLALEVERSFKSFENYENVARFYAEDTKASEVIWIVDRLQNAKSIQKHFVESIGPEANCHSFILVKDFIEHCWQSKFVVGKSRDQTLRSVIGNSMGTQWDHGPKFNFYDTRKKPKDSAPKKNRDSLFVRN